MVYDKWERREFSKGLIPLPDDDVEEGTYRVWYQTTETTIWEFYTKRCDEAQLELKAKKEFDPDTPVRLSVKKQGNWEIVEELP